MALTQKDQKVQDAVAGSWVDNIAPRSWRPYLRLSRFDRPVGAWLLFLPCVFGAALAGIFGGAEPWDLIHFLIVCLIGAWLMRGAGCTWNDIADRNIDAQVERTRSRPIPSGAVNVVQAAIWMAAQMVFAFMALATLEMRTIFAAIGSLVIVAFYPFAKRLTNWPQIVLGLAFNWGVIVAYVELADALSFGMIALYFAMIFWTLYYDTIYAFQDIRDDEQIGVKSTARVLQKRPKVYLANFATVAFLLLGLAGWMDAPRDARFLLLMGAFVFLMGMAAQLRVFDADDRQKCLEQFRGNVRIGQFAALIWLGAYFWQVYF